MVPAPQHFSTALTLDLPPGCLHGTGIKPPSQKGVSQSGVGNSQYFFASVLQNDTEHFTWIGHPQRCRCAGRTVGS